MSDITPNDIHNIHNFDTLLDFLREKLGWQIPEDVELEDIAYPWSPEDLGLDELKEEEVHLNDYDNIAEVEARIGHFIEQVYDQKRPHSALGCLTPVEFDQKTCLNFTEFRP